MEHVDAGLFGGIVLDESSILKNFQGKTRTALIEAFRRTPYKLACTATPSPNDTPTWPFLSGTPERGTPMRGGR